LGYSLHKEIYEHDGGEAISEGTPASLLIEFGNAVIGRFDRAGVHVDIPTDLGARICAVSDHAAYASRYYY